jgi:hypothetical protein
MPLAVNLAAQSFTGRSAMHDAKDERPAEASAADGRCKGGGNCAQCQSERAISATLPGDAGETNAPALPELHDAAKPCATKRVLAGLAP